MAADSWTRGDKDAIGRDFGWSDFAKLSQTDEWSGGYGGAGWGDWQAKYEKDTGKSWADLLGGGGGGDNTGGDNTGGDNTGGDNTGGDNTGDDDDNTGDDDDNTSGDNTLAEASTPATPPPLEGALGTIRDETDAAGVKVGEAGGEEYAGYENTLGDPADYVREGGEYNTAETTVAGQLEKYLSSDSDYMKRAQTFANEQSNALGMMSSSAGVGASTAAAIDRAAPLATEDAKIAAAFKKGQQDAEYLAGQTKIEGEVTGALKQQEAQIAEQQTKLSAQIETTMKGLDATNQATLSDFQKGWDLMIADSQMRLEAELKSKMMAFEIDANTITDVREQASQMIINYQISAEEMLKDPEFLDLGSNAIKATLNNLLRTTAAGIQFVADSSGVNMDDYIDDFIYNAEFTTNV